LDAVHRAFESFHRRIPTAELNRFFRDVLEHNPPPTHGGRAPRLYYITQAETAPPVFIVKSSAPQHVRESYRRFVTNRIRNTFDFVSVPLAVHFKQRGK
jgi:GTP-binding protein